MKRVLISLIICALCLFSTGCKSQTVNADNTGLPTNVSTKPTEEADEQTQQPGNNGSELLQGAGVSPFTSYWDEYAKNFGGAKAYYNSPSIDIDLLPLYMAGLQHEEPYVRWACAYKVFEYYHDDRRPEILKALNPLLMDTNPDVIKAAQFSTDVLTGTFTGSSFVRSPNGKDIAFTPFIESRFNGGQVWLYSSSNDQLSMVLQLTSVGGDSGVAGYINWSPDGRKLAVGDGGRLWSDTVILNLDTMTKNEKGLFTYIWENAEQLGYHVGDYQRKDPQVTFIEWSPDSKKVLLGYSFAEDIETWQSGYAVLNVENDTFEKVMPNKKTDDDYPRLQKPEDFHW